MKTQKLSNGYLFVSLCKDGIVKQLSIHRLVAIAFLLKINNKNEVNHIDGNKKNNHVSNLEWVTRSENNKHAFKTGLRKPARQMLGKFGHDHNKSKECYQISLDGFLIGIYGSQNEASRKTGINSCSISSAIVGRNKTAGGYIWKR